MVDQVQETFYESIGEGEVRLNRSWPSLLATGAVGGMDVSIGVLAFLVVMTATHNLLLASLAFGIGFIALTLASSELFTENFLIPVATVVAGKATLPRLLRLWSGTVVTNLVGGWVVMGLVMLALPELRPAARDLGSSLAAGGITTATFASGLLGGIVITLMTWMERGTDSVPGKLIAALAAAFLLASAHLHHAVVISLEAFAALHTGASFGYADWAAMFGWAVLANMIGGLLLVTLLRLVQVGGATLDTERESNAVGGQSGPHSHTVLLDLRQAGDGPPEVEHTEIHSRNATPARLHPFRRR